MTPFEQLTVEELDAWIALNADIARDSKPVDPRTWETINALLDQRNNLTKTNT